MINFYNVVHDLIALNIIPTTDTWYTTSRSCVFYKSRSLCRMSHELRVAVYF
jgi:hypothetical protein